MRKRPPATSLLFSKRFHSPCRNLLAQTSLPREAFSRQQYRAYKIAVDSVTTETGTSRSVAHSAPALGSESELLESFLQSPRSQIQDCTSPAPRFPFHALLTTRQIQPGYSHLKGRLLFGLQQWTQTNNGIGGSSPKAATRCQCLI
jgi:hypothetical protein